MRRAVVLLLACALSPSLGTTLHAQDEPPPPESAEPPGEADGRPDETGEPEASDRPLLGPYFLGWGDEPNMAAGGRMVAALQGAAAGVLGRQTDGGAVVAAWEVPMGLLVSVVQHEVFGHGGRAREFGLAPSYGAGLDFTFYTSIDRDPGSNEVTALLAGGGIEATGELARRLLLDSLGPAGVEGSQIPLLLFSKLDLTLYVSQTEDPGPGGGEGSFTQQFVDGNDMAVYLVARQGRRLGLDPSAVWNREVDIAFDEALLEESWDAMREAAVWNLLDPALTMAVAGYFRQHLGDGRVRVAAPVLRLADGIGLSAGTRAFLGPAEVSRVLDLYLATRWGVVAASVRDLDSSLDTTYGYGVAMHRIPLGRRVTLGVEGDLWEEPAAAERETPEEDGWRLAAQADVMLSPRFGFAVEAGSKSAGWFPGSPMAEGAFVAAGGLVSF